jgi:hypothetical protein
MVPALAEVAGGATEQVERLDAGSLGDALVTLARDRTRREHLTVLGLARARTFSWERAARETRRVYQAAVNPSGQVASPGPAFAEVGRPVSSVAGSRAARESQGA